MFQEIQEPYSKTNLHILSILLYRQGRQVGRNRQIYTLLVSVLNLFTVLDRMTEFNFYYCVMLYARSAWAYKTPQIHTSQDKTHFEKTEKQLKHVAQSNFQAIII